jgi:membrane fusion protein, heavy metal efflux system
LTSPLLGLLVLSSLSGCRQNDNAKAAKSEKPAELVAVPQETNLLAVHLTPKAEQRLGITTAPVERKSVSRRRTYGGIVTVPPGKTVIVSAPLAGTLAAPDEGQIPVPGSTVQAGQSVFKFVPLLTPDRHVPSPADRVQMANAQASIVSSQLLAEGDVKRGEAEVEAARIALERAQQLLSDGVGSQKAVDEAVAVKSVAEKTLEAATQRKKLLDQLSIETEGGKATPVDITAPESGVLRNMPSSRGQTVAAGEPLFEIVNLSAVWIRVPIYVGEISDIDRAASAAVSSLDSGQQTPLSAEPVEAPPTADELSSTADLYYQLANGSGTFKPGERLSVSLPLRGEAESLVVPAAAILHDVDGGTWVYVKAGEHEFRRQRVSLRFLQDDLAVLARGPEVGTPVVVDGTAELFGTEFGTGK